LEVGTKSRENGVQDLGAQSEVVQLSLSLSKERGSVGDSTGFWVILVFHQRLVEERKCLVLQEVRSIKRELWILFKRKRSEIYCGLRRLESLLLLF